MHNILERIFASLKMPVIKADEEDLVDPQVVLREECGQRNCAALKEFYEKCNTRVLSKKHTTETCAEELLDFMGCVDGCVAKTLFTKLK